VKPVQPILAGLAVLLLVTPARAESRTVLVRVQRDGDRKVSVTIYSDEDRDRRSAVAADEAVKTIAAMRGWGSTVGVYVTADRGTRGDDLRRVLGAIQDNHWLELEYFGREVPKVVGDHFLKRPAGK
jgi:hypothetical protein